MIFDKDEYFTKRFEKWFGRCIVTASFGVLVWACFGCAILQPVIDYGLSLTKQPLSVATNIVSDLPSGGTVTGPSPASPVSSVDTTKPLTMPLRSHGSEADVDRWLAAGGAPECGGISPDIRAMLILPNGKTWGYAPFWKSGAFLGRKADGTVSFKDVPFEGQTYSFVGYSVQENVSTMTKAKAGDAIQYVNGGHGMFTFWETRD